MPHRAAPSCRGAGCARPPWVSQLPWHGGPGQWPHYPSLPLTPCTHLWGLCPLQVRYPPCTPMRQSTRLTELACVGACVCSRCRRRALPCAVCRLLCTGFIALRNSTPTLRLHYSGFAAFVGRHTLELYLLQVRSGPAVHFGFAFLSLPPHSTHLNKSQLFLEHTMTWWRLVRGVLRFLFRADPLSRSCLLGNVCGPCGLWLVCVSTTCGSPTMQRRCTSFCKAALLQTQWWYVW